MGLSGTARGGEGRGLLVRFDPGTSAALQQPSPIKAAGEAASGLSDGRPHAAARPPQRAAACHSQIPSRVRLRPESCAEKCSFSKGGHLLRWSWEDRGRGSLLPGPCAAGQGGAAGPRARCWAHLALLGRA